MDLTPAEQQNQYDLAVARAQQREFFDVKARASVVRPPSKPKYAFLFLVALIGDLVDWLSLTGIGLIVTYLVDIFVGVVLLLAGVRANSKLKAIKKFQDEISQNLAHIERRLVFYAQNYRRALVASRKVKVLRRPVRQIALKISKLIKSVGRNPAMKNMAAIVADLFPFLELVPWRTLSIYLTYRDESKTYEESLPFIEEYALAKNEELTASQEYRQTMAEEFAPEDKTDPSLST